MSMEMQTITTLGSSTLRERAAEAQSQAAREEDARAEGQYQSQCTRLAKLIDRVLGVEREGITFERRNQSGAALAIVDGLRFALYGGDQGWQLDYLSPCETCKQERRAPIFKLQRLGELLVDPAKFYHYCPPSTDPDSTPEARLLTALRDLIVKNAPEYQS